MASFPNILIGTTLAILLVGCSVHHEPILTSIKIPPKADHKPGKPDILKLTDHLIGVATLSDRDAVLAQKCLDKNGIPYGTFVDVSSVGIVVKGDDAERARRLIREDSWNRGYKLLERIPPIPEPDHIALHGPLIDPKPNVPTAPSTATRPTQIMSAPTIGLAKHTGNMVTVVAVAQKDVKAVLACLVANGIKPPGISPTVNGQPQGAVGIVVSLDIAPKVLNLIQQDAKKNNYRLFSTNVREPIPEPNNDWSSPPSSKEDLTSVAHLIIYVNEQSARFVSECLEAHNISSAAAFDENSCGVYVSAFDAERALSLIQENARVKGYSYTAKQTRQTKD